MIKNNAYVASGSGFPWMVYIKDFVISEQLRYTGYQKGTFGRLISY